MWPSRLYKNSLIKFGPSLVPIKHSTFLMFYKCRFTMTFILSIGTCDQAYFFVLQMQLTNLFVWGRGLWRKRKSKGCWVVRYFCTTQVVSLGVAADGSDFLLDKGVSDSENLEAPNRVSAYSFSGCLKLAGAAPSSLEQPWIPLTPNTTCRNRGGFGGQNPPWPNRSFQRVGPVGSC